MEPFTLVYLFIVLLLGTFIDYMLFQHFNTLFEDQFNLTDKLIKMVEDKNKQELNDFDITGNEVMQICEEE
jgi:hypothetical protein